MKIENIGQIKEVEQIQIISEYAAPKFVEGEILIAQIEHIQGDQVMLKNKNGQAFTALMQSDLGLSEGNIVELAANRNGAGFVLHLLDVEKSANTPSGRLSADVIPGTLATMKANPGLDPKAASFLIENNIPRTPENIATLGHIVHDGSGIGAILGEILSEIDNHDIQSGQAAVMPAMTGSQTAQIKGNTDVIIIKTNPEQAATAMLTEVLPDETAVLAGQINDAAGQAAASDVHEQTVISTGQNINAGESVITQVNPQETVNAAAMQPPVADAEAGQNPAQILYTVQQNPETAANAAEQQTDAVSALQVTAADATETQSLNQGNAAGQVSDGTRQVILEEGIYTLKDNPADERETAAAGGVPVEKDVAMSSKQPDTQYTPEVSGAINKEEIKDRILGMFCKPDKQSGTEFKQTITDMHESLNSLKLLLHQSDNQDKGTLMQKADQAQKQMELLSESKRFDCIQIPFMLKNGAEKTAELYVYRHKRSKKESGENGLSVLIALDTQNIGRVETLMKTEGKSISLEFRLEHKEIQPELIKRSKALAKAMENAGYTLKSLRITGLEMKTTVLNAGGVLIPDAGLSAGNIDVQI